jgi:hypothetical protein
MSVTNADKHAKWLRWVARIICLIITAFGGIILIGEVVGEFLSEGFAATSIEGVTLGIIGIIALAGCILSWLRDLPASILLVITSVALGAHIGLCAGRNHFVAWSMLGLPYLVSGVLLLYAWRRSRQTG